MSRQYSSLVALLPVFAVACTALADAPSDSTSENTGELTSETVSASDVEEVEPGSLPPALPSANALVAGAAGPIHILENCDHHRLEQFRVSATGSAEHAWQLSSQGSWTDWASLGGALLYGDIAVFKNADCKIEVLGTGTNNQVYDTWQTANSSGPWHAWTSIGGFVISQPVFAISVAGNPGVCAVGRDHNLWCNFHTQPGSSSWTGWHLQH